MLILKPIEDSVAKIRRILRKYKLFRSSMPLVETYGHLMPLMATFMLKYLHNSGIFSIFAV